MEAFPALNKKSVPILAPTKNQIPSEDLCEKDTYAHYLSYASFVAFMGDEDFSYRAGIFFGFFVENKYFNDQTASFPVEISHKYA